MTQDPLDRLADAAERIAQALEHLASSSTRETSRPRIRVSRSPSDASTMEPVTLRPGEGLMTVLLLNTGDANATMQSPTLTIGDRQLTGAYLDKRGHEHPSCVIPAVRTAPPPRSTLTSVVKPTGRPTRH